MSRIFAIDRDENFKMISNHMNELRKKNELVDFTIVNDLGDQVKGHMIVMALCCPIIKNMVNTGSNDRRLLLRDVSAEAMEQLINFMYIGEVEISANTVNCIMVGASQLEMYSIETLCVDYIRANAIHDGGNPLSLSKNRRVG